MKPKVIVITGASSGIGKDAAKALIKQGHIVYALARRLDQMQDLKTLGGYPIAFDITQFNDIKQVVEQIISKEKRIDVLWNNAGYGLYGAVEDIPIEEARKQFDVNLFGLAAITREVLPHMREANSGTIINTSSMGGKMYSPLGAWYHASKHAIEGFSDCLRLELKSFNIHVVILEPGIIVTEFGDIMLNNVTRYSLNSVYKSLTAQLIKTIQRVYKQGWGSNVSVITKTILKIVKTKKPKTRYRVGFLAKPSVWLRIYFGDRFFDKAVMMIGYMDL